MLRAIVLLSLLATLGCAAPQVTRDGQLVFTESEQRGATVLTANGVELVDRDTRPSPVIRRSAYDPWRPPIGFLLPINGTLTETSRAHSLSGHGLAVVLRPSDVLVPAWGGEILLRLDTVVPPQAFEHARRSLRSPIDLVVVVDGRGNDVATIVDVALDGLGHRDRVVLLDSSRHGRLVLPPVPGTHRTLLAGAVEQVLAQAVSARNLAGALGRAAPFARRRVGRQTVVLVVTDGRAPSRAIARRTHRLEQNGARVVAVASSFRVPRRALDGFRVAHGGHLRERIAVVEDLVAPPGDVVLRDLVLRFRSAPAPVRVLESSGGEVWGLLDDERLSLGDLYLGEARTEVVRLGIPEWVPGEPLRLTVTASYRDASTGRLLRAKTRVGFRYSEDIERIANARHGDVIAYASALAMVRRLERTFLGQRSRSLGGLRALVRRQARSMTRLAEARHDRSLARQALVLETLLAALDH